MSLVLSGFTAGYSTAAASHVQNAYTPAAPAAQAAVRKDGTTITISPEGRALAANDALQTSSGLATEAADSPAVQRISAAESETIGNIFRSAGIDVGTNARFDVDALGNLQISGVDGLTAGKIKSQLDEHPSVVAALHIFSTLST